MGADPSNVVASVAKSLEVDRSPNATQRASDVAQDQIAGESVAALNQKKPDAADELQQARIRREHERRRREMERKLKQPDQESPEEEDDESGIDVVV